MLMQDGTFGHRKYNLAKADFVWTYIFWRSEHHRALFLSGLAFLQKPRT